MHSFDDTDSDVNICTILKRFLIISAGINGFTFIYVILTRVYYKPETKSKMHTESQTEGQIDSHIVIIHPDLEFSTCSLESI